MELYNIVPGLQPYLRNICALESPHTDKASSSTFRVLPDACVEVFLNYKSTSIASIKTQNSFNGSGSFVTSRMSTFMDVSMAPGSGCIAICFKPAMAHYFFAVPMSELSDTAICLEDLWGRRSLQLLDAVASCNTNQQRVWVIQQHLLTLLNQNRIDSFAFGHYFRQISDTKGELQIKALAGKGNISQRQLSRQFNAFLGLSPKQYSRLSRFLYSLAELKNGDAQSLTQTAYTSGYYDQAHFIHDCRDFAGLSPKQLLSGKVIF